MLDLDSTEKIAYYAIIWAGLLVFALAKAGDRRFGSIGLPFAFIASYTLFHVGALAHLVDGYNPAANSYLRGFGFTRKTVADGFEVSCLAMIAATLGFLLAERTYKRRAQKQYSLRLDRLWRGSWLVLAVGICALFTDIVLGRLGIVVPGLQAALVAVRNLFVVGACGIVLHRYYSSGPNRALVAAGGFAVFVPALMLVTTAILSSSLELAIVITAYFMSLSKPAAKHPLGRNLTLVAASIVCAFVFAVGYLQSRDVLRSVVWSGGSVASAVDVARTTLSAFDTSSLLKSDTLELLDTRLNQNILVGLAVAKLQSLPESYEYGATIKLAMLGWVPRFLWPGKPERGGSEFVAMHTGLSFSEGTTVGAGAIFEFYVNYGYTAVIFGFLFMGAIVRRLDIAAREGMRDGDLAKFAQYQLAGLAMLPALSDLLFLIASVIMALIVGRILRIAWLRHISGQADREMRVGIG